MKVKTEDEKTGNELYRRQNCNDMSKWEEVLVVTGLGSIQSGFIQVKQKTEDRKISRRDEM